MTRDDIILIAQEAGVEVGFNDWRATNDALVKFAALVAAHEREECAKACENLWLLESYPGSGARGCVDAIRARGEKP